MLRVVLAAVVVSAAMVVSAAVVAVGAMTAAASRAMVVATRTRLAALLIDVIAFGTMTDVHAGPDDFRLAGQQAGLGWGEVHQSEDDIQRAYGVLADRLGSLGR